MRILGIETSCDETSAAILADGKLLSNIVSSQIIHKAYGGVVPELASRAHQRLIVPVVGEALRNASVSRNEIEGIAVTCGPGLAGALLVGLNFAKGLSLGLGIPFIGINHLEGHIYSNFIDEPAPGFPLLCLLVSGGHTQLILVEKPLSHRLLGETVDDAAGEAFDKVGKMLGLGFPGGPAIDKLAEQGNPGAIRFPRPFLGDESLNFSFSGIKTSVLYWLRDHGLLSTERSVQIDRALLNDLCAGFQAAVVDVLVGKTIRAAERFRAASIAVAGGVSANRELRERMTLSAGRAGCDVYFPAHAYCTDNAAMIAKAGELHFARGERSALDLQATPNLAIS